MAAGLNEALGDGGSDIASSKNCQSGRSRYTSSCLGQIRESPGGVATGLRSISCRAQSGPYVWLPNRSQNVLDAFGGRNAVRKKLEERLALNLIGHTMDSASARRGYLGIDPEGGRCREGGPPRARILPRESPSLSAHGGPPSGNLRKLALSPA